MARESSDRIIADVGGQFLRIAFEGAPVAMVMATLDARFLRVNQAGCEMFGYTEAELIAGGLSLITHPEEMALDTAALERVRLGEVDGFQREKRYLHRDGRVIWGLISLAVVRDNDGRRVALSVQVQDISARRRAEEALREALTLTQAILDGADRMIIAATEEGVITLFNAAAERLLGYEAREVVGKVTPAIIHDSVEVERRARALSAELGVDVAPGFEAFIAKARLGCADENEWTYIRKDGSTFPVLLSVTALHDAAGRISGYLGIASDISERKVVERLKDEFVSTVSHELRTPLTSIRGSLGLLEGGVLGDLPREAREVVRIALTNTERLVRLINDILDLEKIEAGKIELKLGPVAIPRLVATALDGLRATASDAGVSIRADVGAVESLVGDEDRLVQVLTNLVSNGIKFSPRGGVVEVKVTKGAAGALRFSVIDRGPGIADEHLPRLFVKFQQLDASDTREKGGTGLGLAICKAIIEQHRGSIGVESGVGAGSTFWFELPRVAPGR